MQDFQSKRDALFASLDNASLELKGTALDQANANQYTINYLKRTTENKTDLCYRDGKTVSNLERNKTLKNLQGKESIFKRPEKPIGRCLKPRKTPDYQINPHKWKKYSLADVDISDNTNTSAAFAFLKQIDEHREANELTDQDDTTSKKIEFKKSAKIRQKLKSIESQEVADVEIDKPKLKGSKVVMPEYVIGQKKEKRKANNTQNQHRAAGSLTLAHLQDADDEIEEL
ncbi:uncharacterized protein LOC119668269 [Teleopsis dalmanni]|uniref:uncharacterized protein LOC119668269 n=1 Tax=Teleopsis dalmanni TaxID=139649 RepID=UPI0018CDABE4|nr:uncharacterized protein LOC119668269 [Teleopsis dalmanni]